MYSACRAGGLEGLFRRMSFTGGFLACNDVEFPMVGVEVF